MTVLVPFIVKRFYFSLWDLPFVRFKSQHLCGKRVTFVPIFTWMNEDTCSWMCLFMCYSMCLGNFTKIMPSGYPFAHYQQYSKRKKCSLFGLTRFQLNQKCNLFDLVWCDKSAGIHYSKNTKCHIPRIYFTIKDVSVSSLNIIWR